MSVCSEDVRELSLSSSKKCSSLRLFVRIVFCGCCSVEGGEYFLFKGWELCWFWFFWGLFRIWMDLLISIGTGWGCTVLLPCAKTFLFVCWLLFWFCLVWLNLKLLSYLCSGLFVLSDFFFADSWDGSYCSAGNE